MQHQTIHQNQNLFLRQRQTLLSKGFRTIVPVLLGMAALEAPALAQESEPNDTFDNRENLTQGVTTFNGELEEPLFNSSASDFEFLGETLEVGSVDFFELIDLSAGDPFTAVIDNTPGGGDDGPDTVLGAFDESDNLLKSNDDGSPVGNGLASALKGNVNSDGSIRLGVTGFSDFEFVGNHERTGTYDLFIVLDHVLGDVDFVQFNLVDLDPTKRLIAEITSADFDPILGWFDDQGDLIDVDDDGGSGLLSLLDLGKPTNPQQSLYLAVTGYADFDFEGDHNEFGEYTLELRQVPTPALLPGLIGLGVSALRRKRLEK